MRQCSRKCSQVLLGGVAAGWRDSSVEEKEREVSWESIAPFQQFNRERWQEVRRRETSQPALSANTGR